MKHKENENAVTTAAKAGRTAFGTRAVILTLIVLAALIAVNLLVSLLPANVKNIDLTSSGTYTISDAAARAAKKIDEDVTVYYIRESSSEKNLQLETFLERYAALNSHIKLVHIDPATQPGFTAGYTDETLYNGSIIVESAKRYRVINYTDLYYYSFGGQTVKLDDENLAYYQQIYAQYYSSDMPLCFDGQNKLSSALDFVTTDTLPNVYLLTGHGESALSATLTEELTQNNLNVISSLSLLTATSVPADCDMLVIFAPTSDINTDEAAMLLSYLNGGGKILLATLPGVSKLPNLLSVTSAWGMEAKDGIVIETNSNQYYPNYPHYLLPTTETNDATAGLGSLRVMIPMAHGILQGAAQGKTYQPLFSTSDDSYTVETTSTTTEKTETSVAGPLNVAALSTDETNGGQLCWFSSAYTFTDQFNSVTGSNYTVFLSLTDDLCQRDSILSAADPISLNEDSLVVSASAALIWTAVLVILLPLGVLVAGLVIWFRRRRA